MELIRIIIFVRPHRLEVVKSAVAALGVNGMTVGDARGRGNSPEKSIYLQGSSEVGALPIRSRIEVVAPADLKDAIIQAVLDSGVTGEPGDGKLFVLSVQDAIRIRTGERGLSAV